MLLVGLFFSMAKKMGHDGALLWMGDGLFDGLCAPFGLNMTGTWSPRNASTTTPCSTTTVVVTITTTTTATSSSPSAQVKSSAKSSEEVPSTLETILKEMNDSLPKKT
ncbi:hypothetical protein H072_7174 [Dactylellina haptotyla CBS 200.50]|uniref:Uncharacterized protein n=1 Tax=Dactylellina haptotyla (strain CBS 200.50) TaxID=1284197 RepID=S8BIC0_DACHA|nr:hypothetical protein H072_7174 [Dactylellina haptotyla CBS 200.50]